jgi:cell division septal protein FtsQ
MFFRRKAKNRRLGREQVLDVKLRSSKVRAARTRVIAITAGFVFATALGIYVSYRSGEWLLDRLVYENQAFALQQLTVQTDGVISVDQLRRWSGVRAGQNLLALDLSKVKRDLELVPIVQAVSVERVLPHELRIRITEREPVAQVNLPRPKPGGGVELAVFQLDAAGWVMLPVDPAQRSTPSTADAEAMPAISGIAANELQPGRQIVNAQVQAALKFVLAFEESAMAGLVDLKRVDISSPQVLVVTTGQGSEITFGLADYEQQLCRWHDIYQKAQKYGKAIAALDLAIGNNIPARWLEASSLPPSTPKSPKPPRLKKKHV